MSDQPENNLSTELVDFEFPNTVMGRFRQFVHGIAGKWALRTLRQQQNNINQALHKGQQELNASLRQIDQESVAQQKQIGELTALVAQLNQQIDDLQAELDSKE